MIIEPIHRETCVVDYFFPPVLSIYWNKQQKSFCILTVILNIFDFNAKSFSYIQHYLNASTNGMTGVSGVNRNLPTIGRGGEIKTLKQLQICFDISIQLTFYKCVNSNRQSNIAM